MSMHEKMLIVEGQRRMYCDVLSKLDKEIRDMSWAIDEVQSPLHDFRWWMTGEYGYLLKEAGGEPAVIEREGK